jgi:hypothetical protein
MSDGEIRQPPLDPYGPLSTANVLNWLGGLVFPKTSMVGPGRPSVEIPGTERSLDLMGGLSFADLPNAPATAGMKAALPALFKITKHLERMPKFGRSKLKPRRAPNRTMQPKVEAEVERLQERVPMAREQIEAGMGEGGLSWGNLTPMYNRLKEQYGRRGALDRLEGFAARMGPTSVNSRVPPNVARALWAQNAAARGIPIEYAHPTLSGGEFGPQGHMRYFSAMQPGLERIQAAERAGLSPLMGIAENKKTGPYGYALAGDYGEVGRVVNPHDVHEQRFWYGDWDKPGPKMLGAGISGPENEVQRRAVSEIYNQLTQEYGITPFQLMASRWVGGAQMTGIKDPRPLLAVANDQIEKLAKSLGVSPEEAFDAVFSGRIEVPLGAFQLEPGVAYPATTVGTGKFVAARDAAKSGMGDRGIFLGNETADELGKDATTRAFFLAHDGKVGGFVSADGYLGNLFNYGGPPGSGTRLARHMIDVAGPEAHLDHFDGPLSKIYDDLGLTEVTSVTPYDPKYAPPGAETNKYMKAKPDYIERRLPREADVAEALESQPIEGALRPTTEGVSPMLEEPVAGGLYP